MCLCVRDRSRCVLLRRAPRRHTHDDEFMCRSVRQVQPHDTHYPAKGATLRAAKPTTRKSQHPAVALLQPATTRTTLRLATTHEWPQSGRVVERGSMAQQSEARNLKQAKPVSRSKSTPHRHPSDFTSPLWAHRGKPPHATGRLA